MRRSQLGAIVCACVASACTLFTDLDGFSGASGDGTTTTDAGTDAPPLAPDGGAEASVDAGPTYRDLVLADAPIAYWPMDDEVGSLVAKDARGKFDATVVSTCRFGEPGVAGGALAIDAEGPRLEVPDGPDFVGDAPYTFEAWAKPTYTVEFQNVFNKRDSASGTTVGFVLFFRNTGTPQFEQTWSGGQRVGWFEATPKVAAFSHVVVTFDGKAFKFYLDGVLGTKNFSDPGGPAATTKPLLIGNNFAGVLDELAIYDKALPPERITVHFKAGRQP